MGDEICCENPECVEETLLPLSNKMRSMLGPEVIAKERKKDEAREREREREREQEQERV